METNTAGQSPGEQKVRGKEPVRILYSLLGLRMDHDQKVRCKVRMPSNLPDIYGPASGDNLLVVLDVKDLKDQSSVHCVKLMMECLHKNILHARVVMEKDPHLLILVENYTGLLLTYLKSREPYIPMLADLCEPRMIPSPKLMGVVSQLIDGLTNLWKHNKFHGNFKLKNTCYLKTADGDIVVKLTGFKGQIVSGLKSVPHYQAQDARCLGEGLSEIAEIAKDFNKQGCALDCFQIEHLAQRLKNVSPGDLQYAMEEIKTYPFFWTYVETKFFLVAQVPLALDSNFVRSKIEAANDLCTLPWNNNPYDGFLQLMVDYRKNNGKRPYNYNSRVSYVQFISGLYAHEDQLQHPYAHVDTVVKLLNPRLFVVLYRLLPRPLRSAIGQ